MDWVTGVVKRKEGQARVCKGEKRRKDGEDVRNDAKA